MVRNSPLVLADHEHLLPRSEGGSDFDQCPALALVRASLYGDGYTLGGFVTHVPGQPVTWAPGTGGDDTLAGGPNSTNYVYGDGFSLQGSTGGDDTIIGGAYSVNYLYGDGDRLAGAGGLFSGGSGSTGGDDTLTGGAYSVNYLYGDAYFLSGAPRAGSSVGGDDTLTGGAGGINYLYGDAFATVGGGAATSPSVAMTASSVRPTPQITCGVTWRILVILSRS